MARRKKKISKPKNNTFAIIVDGETEVWYFQMLKRNEPSLQINIEPKIPQKKKLSDQCEKVLELSEVYTKVFWIIDLDVVIRDGQVHKFKEYLNEVELKNNVITILNNPCLEYWFLLHYESISKYFPKCSNAEKQFKKHLKDYKKTQKYFTKQNSDIYLKLKSNLSTALANTLKTQRKSIDELKRGICEMNLFFETEQINIKE